MAPVRLASRELVPRTTGIRVLENTRFDPGETKNDQGSSPASSQTASTSTSTMRRLGPSGARLDPGRGAPPSGDAGLLLARRARASRTPARRRRAAVRRSSRAAPRSTTSSACSSASVPAPTPVPDRREDGGAAARARSPLVPDPATRRRRRGGPVRRGCRGAAATPLAPVPDGWLGLDIGPATPERSRPDRAARDHLLERPDGRLRMAALRGRHHARSPRPLPAIATRTRSSAAPTRSARWRSSGSWTRVELGVHRGRRRPRVPGGQGAAGSRRYSARVDRATRRRRPSNIPGTPLSWWLAAIDELEPRARDEVADGLRDEDLRTGRRGP